MNLKSLLIGAFGGAVSGGLLISGYIVGRVIFEGAQPGDWLNFAAVVFGVALTILGTYLAQKVAENVRASARKKKLIKLTEAFDREVQECVSEPEKLLTYGPTHRYYIRAFRWCISDMAIDDFRIRWLIDEIEQDFEVYSKALDDTDPENVVILLQHIGIWVKGLRACAQGQGSDIPLGNQGGTVPKH